MAFSYTVTQRPIVNGNKRFCYGTFDAGTDASGVINTGLRMCEHITLTVQTATGGASEVPGVVELPVSGDNVTLNFTDTAMTGFWKAEGY